MSDQAISINDRIVQPLSRLNKLPLYIQLYELLRSKILHSDWKVGEMIPTETDLIETYQVSRSTVRQVLDRLALEGLIQRQQGRGTFVNGTAMQQGLTRIISFPEDVLNHGMEPTSRILFSGLVPCPENVAISLQIPTESEVAHLESLRLMNDEPMCIEEAYLVHRFCPGILSHDIKAKPLRMILELNYGLRISRAIQTIRAVSLTNLQAKQLCIPPRSPILFIERTSYTDHEVPIEFQRLSFRGDRYSLLNELRD